jgi:hypothetical protein
MKNELSTQLKKEEKIIQRTKGAFVECGLALARIRDGKLYRSEYETFEGYCSDKWGWGRQRAYQLIEAAETAKGLPRNVNNCLQNEGQARELSKVPKDDREEVLEKASRGGIITAKTIKEAAREKVIELDKVGREIPEEILPDWNRAEEVGNTLRQFVSKVKCEVEKGVKEEDLIFAELHNTDIAPIEGVHFSLKQIIPYAVCPTCQGKNRTRCRLCDGRGFISQFRWKQGVPEEIKNLSK